MGVRNAAGNEIDLSEALNEVILQCERSSGFNGISWDVNPPTASHFGGVWERHIGCVRRAFEALLAIYPEKHRLLSQEEFDTLLAKAEKIVNSTPLWEVPDTEGEPQPLSPFMLLTQRDGLGYGEVVEYDPQNFGPRRWRRLQELTNDFATEWRRHYLYPIGDRRQKWQETYENLKIKN